MASGDGSRRQYDGKWLGFSLKHVSLVALTVQNTLFILLVHYSRVMPPVGGHRYITSTAVFMNEVLKLAVNLTASLIDASRSMSSSTSATSLFKGVIAEVFTGDSWKLAIPSCLYVLQNSLQYVALSNLDSTTYQVTCQLKILPTAIFTVLLLKRSLSARQWASLGLLMFGVAIVQLPMPEKALAPFRKPHWFLHLPRSLSLWQEKDEVVGAHIIAKRSATYEGIAEDESLLDPPLNAALGIAASLTGTTAASAASVYFEKIVKQSETQASLWIRNVQLAFYSLFPALFLGVIFVDGEKVAQRGFFVGYNWAVWCSVALQALGGVLVSLAVKYADNITKSFAISFSILMSLVASVWFFDFVVTKHFVFGTSTVLFATYLYNSGQRSPSRSRPVKIHNFEKLTIDRQRPRDNAGGLRLPHTPLVSSGLTSSRPGSPVDHHSRRGSSRQYFGSKERDD